MLIAWDTMGKNQIKKLFLLYDSNQNWKVFVYKKSLHRIAMEAFDITAGRAVLGKEGQKYTCGDCGADDTCNIRTHGLHEGIDPSFGTVRHEFLDNPRGHGHG